MAAVGLGLAALTSQCAKAPNAPNAPNGQSQSAAPTGQAQAIGTAQAGSKAEHAKPADAPPAAAAPAAPATTAPAAKATAISGQTGLAAEESAPDWSPEQAYAAAGRRDSADGIGAVPAPQGHRAPSQTPKETKGAADAATSSGKASEPAQGPGDNPGEDKANSQEKSRSAGPAAPAKVEAPLSNRELLRGREASGELKPDTARAEGLGLQGHSSGGGGAGYAMERLQPRPILTTESKKKLAQQPMRRDLGDADLLPGRWSGVQVRAPHVVHRPLVSDKQFRPLPPPVAFYPKDSRYRSTYLPGRGDLQHLGAWLTQTAKAQSDWPSLDLAAAAQPLPSVPAPTGRALDVAVDQLHGQLPPDGGETTLRVRLRASDTAPGQRTPVHLTLILDSSGSMRGASWRAVCASAQELSRVMQPQDTLAAVHYGSTAAVISGPVNGNSPAIHDLAKQICQLRVRGETNIAQGLQLGYQMARDSYQPGTTNRVLLVSDGMATVGPRDVETLTAPVAEALGAGVTTSALGVGHDFDALLMARIALEGGGNDHFVREPTAVPAVLADELDVLAREAAEAVDLRIRLADDLQLLEVIGGEPLDAVQADRVRDVEVRTDQRLQRDQGLAMDRQRDQQGGVRMMIPSFRLGDEHTILLRLRVPGGQGERGLARVELRYKDMISKRNVKLIGDRTATYAQTQLAADAAVQDDVAASEARARAGWALQRASQYLDPANLPRISMELQAASSGLRAAADRTGQPDLHQAASAMGKLATAAQRPTRRGEDAYLASVFHYAWRNCGVTRWR